MNAAIADLYAFAAWFLRIRFVRFLLTGGLNTANAGRPQVPSMLIRSAPAGALQLTGLDGPDPAGSFVSACCSSWTYRSGLHKQRRRARSHCDGTALVSQQSPTRSEARTRRLHERRFSRPGCGPSWAGAGRSRSFPWHIPIYMAACRLIVGAIGWRGCRTLVHFVILQWA